jgi:hypothetical protein
MSTPEDIGAGNAGAGNAGAGNAGAGNGQDGDQDGDQDYGDQERINIRLVWILGIALLGLVFGIVYLSIRKETVSLPTGLTSLASLIAGGLLALLNPVHGSRTSQKSGAPSQKGKNAKPKG